MNSKKGSLLVVGIGSPFGDDRVGWEVVDRLAEWPVPVGLKKATVPHNLLDWIQHDCDLHIIDACRSDVPGIHRYTIEQERDGSLRVGHSNSGQQLSVADVFEGSESALSHQLDLLTTLRLASSLGIMPTRTILWTISVEHERRVDELTPEAVDLATQCADLVRKDILDVAQLCPKV